MMEPALLSNIAAVITQAACVVLAAGLIIGALRINSPTVTYALWRTILVVTLLLPWLQRPATTEMTIDEVVVANATGPTRVAMLSTAPTPQSVDWTVVALSVIGAGIALRLAWLMAGVVRLRRLRAEGEAAAADEFASLQAALGTGAEVRYVETLRQPATFGLRLPVVLLPASLRDTPDALRAVLAHELVHVHRGDWGWHIAEELLRAVCWFHPAVWWTITRIQLAREEVVDARAVKIVGDRRLYVRALLRFADESSRAPAPAFARKRHLFRRIVLLSSEEAMSAHRVVVSACVVALVLAVVAWSSIAAFPTQAAGDVIQVQPGPLEQAAALTSPENPVPTLVHLQRAVRPSSAIADQADVSVTLRTVIDQSGTVVEVRLTSFTFKLADWPSTMMGGPESVPGFQHPVLQEFIEAAAQAVKQSRYEAPVQGPAVFTTITQFTPDDTLAITRTVPMVQRVSAEGAIKVGNGMKPPLKVKDVRPVYPAAARDAGVQGVVILEIRIERDGRVSSAGVLRSIPALDQAALDAVYQWEFRPALMNGAPVPVILTVTVQFTAA